MPRTQMGRGRRLKAAASAVVLTAGTGVAVIAAVVAGPGTPASAAVPAPPAGFTTTWSDDFDGASGTGVDTGVWKYDTGPGRQPSSRASYSDLVPQQPRSDPPARLEAKTTPPRPASFKKSRRFVSILACIRACLPD